jgi:hypothetical protein
MPVLATGTPACACPAAAAIDAPGCVQRHHGDSRLFHELERAPGVDKSKGMDSYDYVLTYEAITIDSRFMWRARTPHGYYWKTFDIFTQGESDYERWHIDQAYRNGHVTYPFWANPIPKFVANQGGTTPEHLSYVATLPLGAYSFDTRGSVGRYTGADGPQQSAEEVIFSLPNGLQGYVLFGAWNHRGRSPGVGRGTYFGPGAPAGPRYHHYMFELYALSATWTCPPTPHAPSCSTPSRTSSSARPLTWADSGNSRPTLQDEPAKGLRPLMSQPIR